MKVEFTDKLVRELVNKLPTREQKQLLYVEKQGRAHRRKRSEARGPPEDAGVVAGPDVSYGGSATWRSTSTGRHAQRGGLPDGSEKDGADAALGRQARRLARDEPRRGPQGGARVHAARAGRGVGAARHELRHGGGALAERKRRAARAAGPARRCAAHRRNTSCPPGARARSTTSIRTTSTTCSTTSPTSTGRSWRTTCWHAVEPDGLVAGQGQALRPPAARHPARHAREHRTLPQARAR